MIEDGVKTYTANIKNKNGVMLKRDDYNFPEGKHIRTFTYDESGSYVKTVKEFNPKTGKATKETEFRKDKTIKTVASFDEETGNVSKIQYYNEDGKTIKINTIVDPKTTQARMGKLPENNNK